MQIRLKNIGIIKDSVIALDGLTIITGKNNSGKTTVGKTLYSLFDAVADLQRKAENDKLFYIMRYLHNLDSTLEFLRYFRPSMLSDSTDFFSKYPILNSIATGEYQNHISLKSIENLVYELINELRQLDSSIIVKEIFTSRASKIFKFKASDSQQDSLKNSFDVQKEQAISELEKIISDINQDPELINYARESINQTLRIEFSNQIQPIKGQDGPSEIELWDNEKIFFHFSIENNSITNNGTPVFTISPYKKAYLIDDPFILDDPTSKFYRRTIIEDHDSFFNPRRISTHRDKLISVLRSKKRPTVFEQTILNDILKDTELKIDGILPGSFDFSSEGEYYIHNGIKLKISNLATGSKMFSIIKMLLQKGEINDSTMLILDEPEAHLHPQWQNAFAEIIVLLVKDLHVNILLTTHSPNFVLALDAYMRKYKISQCTNFYQTNIIENGFVNYQCVNDNIGIIYQDFLQYLSEVKMLRNKYLTCAEE